MWLGNLRLGVASQHLVDRTNDVEHLLLADQAVAVQVVESKDPLQLLLGGAPRDLGEDRQEVLIKNVKINIGFENLKV